MVNALEFYELENKARESTVRFIAEAISQPTIYWAGQTIQADPESSLCFLLTEVAQGDPKRLHRICRIAWAEHCQTGKPHWEAISAAARLI